MTKEHILEAIRRTADSNGGVPLGRQRFLRETGIRESDWSGRYWTRWSDAVREAGFEPNTLESRRDDDEVLSYFVDLARTVGRVPTNAELRMARRTHPGFPSHNVFARLGGKHELVAAALAYCQREGRAAEAELFAAAVAQAEQSEPDGEAHPTETVDGFVYLLKSGRFYKIGRTNATGRREREIQLQLPEKASTVHVITTDDPAGIEAYWHRRFADRRQNGEWFALSREDVSAFRRRRFM
jgi:hypothetical protein